jgi:hypothetical protein
MKSKGITIIKEENKVLNISNINSLPDIKDTSFKDKQLSLTTCKQQLISNTQHQTRQTSPQCITTTNIQHDTTMSPLFQTTSKLLNKQRSIIFQRERQPNSTQQTTPSITTTIDKATSTIYPHSSLPFSNSSTNSYKNIRSITTSKQKVIEHICRLVKSPTVGEKTNKTAGVACRSGGSATEGSEHRTDEGEGGAQEHRAAELGEQEIDDGTGTCTEEGGSLAHAIADDAGNRDGGGQDCQDLLEGKDQTLTEFGLVGHAVNQIHDRGPPFIKIFLDDYTPSLSERQEKF